MNIIGKRKIWYAISVAIILPGVISLLVNGLKLGIDFTGGSLMEVEGSYTRDEIAPLAGELDLENMTVTSSGESRTLIRFRDPAEDPTEQEQRHQQFRQLLSDELGAEEVRFETVGPSVSRDIARNAIVAIIVVSLAIVLYIAIAFRNTPPPIKPVSFGVATIIALIHDSIFLIGVFSIFGWLFGAEIDALFVTAVLTVIGFSVHDTIVVFDRIRENLRRENKPFETVVNDSVLETMGRSLNTSVTVLLVLLALYLFGGESIKLFVLALLIGIAAGTYSSIFNASPLLVTYHNWQQKRVSAKA